MSNRPTYGSMFTGVAGMDMGFDPYMDCRWQIEWDKDCQQTLEYHYRRIPRYGDIATVPGRNLDFVDTIIFGSPCQDLSLATNLWVDGNRSGLKGPKSSMFFEGARIIREMRQHSGNEYPKIVVWENVAGALSSNKGNDFLTVLQTLENIGALAIEWHILDARWFGVPQRRKRIFVVAIFDTGIANTCPPEILPVAPRRTWNPPTVKKAWKKYSAQTEAGATGTGYRMVGFGEYADDDLASAIKHRDYKDVTDIIVHYDRRPRRLTPVESERLMGWPDNHTLWRADGTHNSDTTRYKMIGNGVATPVADFVARHVAKLVPERNNV